MLRRLAALACAIACGLVTARAHAATTEPAPEWTVVAYLATDADDIGPYGEKLYRQLLESRLGAGVELLIEYDAWGDTGVKRVIRRGSAPAITTRLAEKDSASPRTFASFLKWATDHAQGSKRLLAVLTHSWGWKGIIQDYTVPGHPGDDTMLPLRQFADAVTKSQLRPDVLFLDSCILATSEALDQLREVAPYIVASERETPYSSFPYPVLLDALARPGASPREVARLLPEHYVRPYTRGGALAAAEGEYSVVTFAAFDMSRWNAFTGAWAGLTRALKHAGLHELLRREPDWAAPFWDEDHNVDVGELLGRLPGAIENDDVADASARVREVLGYPARATAEATETIALDPAEGASFSLVLDGDENVAADKALGDFKDKFRQTNQDLELPSELAYAVSDEPPGRRTATVSGRVARAFRLRPWLPGVLTATLSFTARDGHVTTTTLTRARDYVSVRDFPAGSLFVSEAHTFGAPFIHGLGIDFLPTMDSDEERSDDPLTRLSGPAFYRTLSWNQRTGWGDLILLKP